MRKGSGKFSNRVGVCWNWCTQSPVRSRCIQDSRLHHGESAKLTSPDLLIIGTGPSVYPIAPNVRKYLNDLGIRLEIQDTRNAAAQFNLLATERGVGQVAAALVPIGWRESK
jgi:uncharacterized protein